MSYILAITARTVLALTQPDQATCVELVETAPDTALQYAERWETLGGGGAATHCRAMAHLALGAPRVSASLLTALADQARQDPSAAARLYVQAAEAWMAGGARDESYAALRAAYDLVPDAAEVHMAAATIYATGAEWEGVVLALRALERHAALSADAYALRARGAFERQAYSDAAADVVLALRLDPYLVDALVLRGELAGQGVSLPPAE